jgi:putative restriction endonuclease
MSTGVYSAPNLRIWKRGKDVAPHKPLLLLILAARAANGEPNRLAFKDVSDKLTQLLKEFGPGRKTHHPEHPFWHLQGDMFWKVQTEGGFPPLKSGASPSKGNLIKYKATGSLDDDLWQSLSTNAAERAEFISSLLHEYWPETLHPALRDAIGLEEAGLIQRVSRKRDPQFRDAVLMAYRWECAVCGFDARLGGNPLGLQAAHLRWHAYQGPDEIANGLALCAFHHLALDSGAIGISRELTLLVSAELSGSRGLEELIYPFEGKPLRQPQPGMPRLAEAHIDWHARQVFKSPARYTLPSSAGAKRAAE